MLKKIQPVNKQKMQEKAKPSTIRLQIDKSKQIVSELIEIDHNIEPLDNISTKRLHLSFTTKMPIRECILFANKLLNEGLGTGTTGEVNILQEMVKYEINVYRDFMFHLINHLCLETTTSHDELNIIYGPVNISEDEDLIVFY